MNDFTKEDLFLISDALTSRSFEEYDKGESGVLRAKVLSMIDYYCEHKTIKEVSDSDYVYVCQFCDKAVGYK